MKTDVLEPIAQSYIGGWYWIFEWKVKDSYIFVFANTVCNSWFIEMRDIIRAISWSISETNGSKWITKFHDKLHKTGRTGIFDFSIVHLSKNVATIGSSSGYITIHLINKSNNSLIKSNYDNPLLRLSGASFIMYFQSGTDGEQEKRRYQALPLQDKYTERFFIDTWIIENSHSLFIASHSFTKHEHPHIYIRDMVSFNTHRVAGENDFLMCDIRLIDCSDQPATS